LPDQAGEIDRGVLAGMKEKLKQLLLELERPRRREDFAEDPRTDE